MAPGPGGLRDRLHLAFFRHDPANLVLDDRHPVGYAAEVERLVAELPSMKSEAHVRELIYRLVASFDSAREPFDDGLYQLAAEVWHIWTEWSKTNSA